MERATVGPNSTPRMSMRSWKAIPSDVGGSVHAPTASALDLRGFRRAPVARSYARTACCIVMKASGSVTKTVKSSAYAMTGPCCACLPIFILGSLSSSDRRRGKRHKAKRNTLRDNLVVHHSVSACGQPRTQLFVPITLPGYTRRVCALQSHSFVICGIDIDGNCDRFGLRRKAFCFLSISL